MLNIFYVYAYVTLPEELQRPSPSRVFVGYIVLSMSQGLILLLYTCMYMLNCFEISTSIFLIPNVTVYTILFFHQFHHAYYEHISLCKRPFFTVM